MNTKVYNNAIIHLKKDDKLYPIIVKFGNLDFGKKIPPFSSLLKYIIYQQLSIHSAKAIHIRFLKLFNDNPTPHNCIKISSDTFKEIGLSKQKIDYIYNIANYFLEKSFSFNNIIDASSLLNPLTLSAIRLRTVSLIDSKFS